MRSYLVALIFIALSEGLREDVSFERTQKVERTYPPRKRKGVRVLQDASTPSSSSSSSSSSSTPSSPSPSSGYSCIHDNLLESTPETVQGLQEYAPLSSSSSLRNLQSTTISSSSSWKPIRIQPVYVGFSSLSVQVSQFLTNSLIPAAIQKWQSLLSVDRVVGNLFAHRECSSYWTNSNGSPYVCAEFYPDTVCDSGAAGDIPISFSTTYKNFLGTDLIYSNLNNKLTPLTVAAGGSGLANADLGLFITAVSSSDCGSTVLAYASTCQRDQLDRPTWGRINFCPNNLDITTLDKLDAQVAVAVHEIGHVLGFSSSSFPLFRNDDTLRSPLTPRNPNFPSIPRDDFWLTRSCGGKQVTSWISSETTLGYSTGRGMTSTSCGTINKGPETCILEVRTPRATLAARSYFGCSTLKGAELENQLTSACDFQGSHWEQRLFNGEIMNSYMVHSAKISPVTLALLEDSSWYIANYSNADRFKIGLDWGFSQGCQFVNNKCLDSSGIGLGQPPHFYSQQRTLSLGNAVCTIDRLAVGQAELSIYSKSLPLPFQYYTDPTIGGYPNTLDYCPGIQGLSNRHCKRTSDGAAYSAKSHFGETFGARSSCFLSTLVYSSSAGYAPGGAGCFEEVCNTTLGALLVTIARPGGASPITVQCTFEGQKLSVSGFSGFLTCPSYDAVCVRSAAPIYSPNSSEIKTYVWPSSIPVSSPSTSSTDAKKVDYTNALLISAGVLVGVSVLTSFGRYVYKKHIQRQQPQHPVSSLSPVTLPSGSGANSAIVMASPPPMYSQQPFYIQQYPQQQYPQQQYPQQQYPQQQNPQQHYPQVVYVFPNQRPI
jgi:leishmanolysin-like peptidase